MLQLSGGKAGVEVCGMDCSSGFPHSLEVVSLFSDGLKLRCEKG